MTKPLTQNHDVFQTEDGTVFITPVSVKTILKTVHTNPGITYDELSAKVDMAVPTLMVYVMRLAKKKLVSRIHRHLDGRDRSFLYPVGKVEFDFSTERV